MERLIYFFYRAFVGSVGILPLPAAFWLGQGLGWVAYWVVWPYRSLATANLTIAYGAEKTPREIRRLARVHFVTLGANLLSSIKAATLDVDQLRSIAEVENIEALRAAFSRGRGVVLVISHFGNWELFAQICQFMPEQRWSTVYQPLGNRLIESHVQRARMSRGVELFSRKNGFAAPTAFLRAGGAVGVLVDQHAGDGGVWAPFFGRLASTSNLAALLALRTGAALVPIAIRTVAPARWRVVISNPIEQVEPADALTARINRVLEDQIRASPADWFWVHNRWKTPKPKFLLTAYRRGVTLPSDVSELKPFRLLVRSPNWLGDAVMAIPAVQAISRGRPDAEVTILCRDSLADLWRIVPGVKNVLSISRNAGVLSVASEVKKAGAFDAALILPNSLRAALEMRLAGVPRRAGYAGHRRQWLLDQVIEEPKPGARQLSHGERPHHSRRYAHLAHAIGAGEVADFPEAPAISRPTPERGAWLKIAICPGAEYGPAKRWFAERFAECARQVGEKHAVRWVLLGVESDRAAGEPIAAALGERCENLIGKTTLAELMDVLRGCRALLTNDTGAMHLAAYLGTPVAAIFGSTDPIATGPLAPPERVRILRHQVECSPCFLRKCPIDFRCMKAVSAEEAAAALEQLLALAS